MIKQIRPEGEAGRAAEAETRARRALAEIEETLERLGDRAAWEAMTVAQRWEAQRRINIALLMVCRAVILRLFGAGRGAALAAATARAQGQRSR